MPFKEFYTLTKKEREKIMKKIKKDLSKRKEIVFAYLYGSFLKDPCFRDIDLGVYLNERVIKPEKFFSYQKKLGQELKIPAKYLLDLRILNEAPFSFLASVFSRGKLILSRDDLFLTDLIERVSAEEIASEAFSKAAFEEMIS